MTGSQKSARLLVVDLDDTLWTWFDPWHESFQALLSEMSQLSGLSQQRLIEEIRPIHQRRGTSEYSWLIDELDILDEYLPKGMTRREYYDPALHAQNRARKYSTALYPGVKETLRHLQTVGTRVVGYTESLAFWTRWRISRTGIDGLLSELYSARDHDSPTGLDPKERRRAPAEDYELESTIHRHVPDGEIKPNPAILKQIIDDHGVSAGETVYVGDSLIKDVAMAQSVGAIDVLAKYGVRSRDPRYALLQSVSHWTDSMMRHEQDNRPGILPTPTLVLERNMTELLSYVKFQPTRIAHV